MENALLDEENEVDRWFRGGGLKFMRYLPLPCWFFVGVESINLACKDMVTPKISVPRGSVACIATLLITCVGVLFVCCSLDPGVAVLQNSLNPLNSGFMKIFKLSYRAATGLTLPATYATASGFMFCFGRQLRAMGQSGLVNHIFGETFPGWTTPVYALTAGSAVAFAVCFVVQASPLIGAQVFNICMLFAFASYGTQFASFIVLRTRYATIKREFISPLGIAGAVYGFIVFTLPFVAICGFQDNFIAIITFVGFVALVSIYYRFVAHKRQFFSDEEKDVMFRAYLMKCKISPFFWPRVCDAER
jgi:amino acid transporter